MSPKLNAGKTEQNQNGFATGLSHEIYWCFRVRTVVTKYDSVAWRVPVRRSQMINLELMQMLHKSIV